MSCPTKIWGVVPAAGIGKRMQLGFPKQYLLIGSKTVLQYSIDSLLQLEALEKLVVCIAPHDDEFGKLPIKDQRVSTAVGGVERVNSVLNGLNALTEVAEAEDWVLVHDAARPCLNAEDLHRLVSCLENDPVGGILATRSKDTIKLANEPIEQSSNAPSIKQTLDRALVWQAQTPQMFRYGLLKDALTLALSREPSITDEASAMELAGHSVKLVESVSPNLKITSPADQALAQFLLNQQ